jgi:hypothetical protein
MLRYCSQCVPLQRHACVELEHDGVDVKINYPRDKESVWFMTEPEWLSEEINVLILNNKLKVRRSSPQSTRRLILTDK